MGETFLSLLETREATPMAQRRGGKSRVSASLVKQDAKNKDPVIS